jgi:glycerol-3-phosphate dehydrogenase
LSRFDIAVVGAGNVGAAIARELARFELRVVLIDAGDVGAGTSKANTAILHTGFDAKPGTTEARLVARGHDLLLDYAGEVGIPVERTGALLVAWTAEELARLPEIVANAEACGYRRVAPVGVDELYRLEPNLAPGAVGALSVPDEFIICPWTPSLAYATQAVQAGVTLRHRLEVLGLERDEDGWRLATASGPIESRWLVNAGGLYSDELHRHASRDGFTVTPRRGELIVFDKLTRPLVDHVILPVPTARTKGVLVAPTVFGNVLVGPTAEDLDDKAETGTSEAGLRSLRAAAGRLMPQLLDYEVTAAFAGLRAATEHDDYQLGVDSRDRYLWAGGVRSTGLTSAMAVAEWAVEALDGAGLELRERKGGLPPLRMPNIGEATPRPFEDAGAIAADPAYGEVVCFCERVSKGEVRDALAATVPATDLDGVRRRTRALTGRCQGFFCGAAVAAQLERSRSAGEGR